MHSLGTRSLEDAARVATPAIVTAQLAAALEELVATAGEDVDTYRARRALELAGKALHRCRACGSRLPVDPRTRAIPPHRDDRDRLCTYSGALLTSDQARELRGHVVPA